MILLDVVWKIFYCRIRIKIKLVKKLRSESARFRNMVAELDRGQKITYITLQLVEGVDLEIGRAHV